MGLTDKQRELFFIIGPGRGGTSILQEIMNCFENFCNIEESRIIGDQTINFWTPVRKKNDFSQLENFIEKNWTSKYFVEKTPDSILCLPQLNKKFPEANYIFLQRSPVKIVLSLLNMFSELYDIKERFYHIENLIMNEDDLLLNQEQYYAKMILKQITVQLDWKEKFGNSLIIFYENLVSNPESEIKKIEKKFGISANIKKVLDTLKRSSYSSKNVRHPIKNIKDISANSMLKQSCEMWDYDFNKETKNFGLKLGDLSSLKTSYNEIDSIKNWTKSLQSEIKSLVEKKLNLENDIFEKDSQIKEKDNQIKEKDNQIKETNNYYTKVIGDIHNSKTWKIIQFFFRKKNNPK